MSTQTITTSIGEIAYYQRTVAGTTPVIFLHGVYYDHHLWNYQVSRITNRTVITIDMPLHGKSKNITKKDWTLTDCSQMLIEILDGLQIEKCYAIGHSWGSMTALRAAAAHPERFVAIGLANMPTEAGSWGAKLQFGCQHLRLGFRGFYTEQVAKAMFSAASRTAKPELAEYLEVSMQQLSDADIRQTDAAVIMNAEAATSYLQNLQVPALAIHGQDDYVTAPENIPTTVVAGKHTSPLEQPEEMTEWMEQVFLLSAKN